MKTLIYQTPTQHKVETIYMRVNHQCTKLFVNDIVTFLETSLLKITINELQLLYNENSGLDVVWVLFKLTFVKFVE